MWPLGKERALGRHFHLEDFCLGSMKLARIQLFPSCENLEKN